MFTASDTSAAETGLHAARWFAVLLACVLACLAGCTSVQFEGTESRLDLTPEQIVRQGGDVRGTVVWGGRIVAVANLEQGTEIQVLAVPLTSGNVPRPGESSLGRFIARYPGFLEPLDYAPGRYVSLAGSLDGLVDGSIGDKEVAFPLVRTAQIHLWPEDTNQWKPQWNIGVGVGVRL